MKSNFGLRRIGLMLKADWIEYKKSFLLYAGLILAVNLFLLREISNGLQFFIFLISVFATLRFFCTYVVKKVSRSKNRFLTLPSGAMEKFAEILIVGFIFFCIGILIHSILLGCSYLIHDTPTWIMQDILRNVQSDSTALGGLQMLMGILLFCCTFIFMCCIAFRKYPIQIGLLLLGLYGFVFSYTVYLFAKIEDFRNLNIGGGFFSSNATIETTVFLNTYSAWGLGIASLALLYVSYLKLKEKQIR